MSAQQQLGLPGLLTPTAGGSPDAPAAAPAAEPKAPDLWSMIVRKKFGLPDGWRWFHLELIEETTVPRDQSHSLVKGAIPTGEVYKSGRYKGHINYRKVVPGSERTAVVSFREYDAFVAQWELESGCCSSCGFPKTQPNEKCVSPRRHTKTEGQP